MTVNHTQARPSGVLSLANKFGIYAVMGFLATYTVNATGLDIAAIAANPETVDWRMLGSAVARLSEAAALDVRNMISGPLQELVAGFSGASGISGLNVSRTDSMGDVAEEILRLPIMQVAY